MQCYESLPLEGNKRTKLCPVDKMEILELFQDKSALLEIINLKVFCYFQKQGCPWVGKIFNFLEHIKNECNYASKWQICEFSSIGCKQKGSKEEMKVHVQKGYGVHLDYLGRKLAKCSNSIEQASSVCESISFTINECSKRLAEDSDGILAVSTSISSLTGRIDKVKSDYVAVSEQQTQNNRQCHELEATDNSPRAVKTVAQDLNQKFQWLAAKAQDIETNPNVTAVTILDNALGSNKDYKPKLKRLENERKTRRENLSDVDLKIRLFQASTTDGRYMWKIDDYHRRMNEAVEGKIVELYSPPIYSDVFGYKLCCKIYLDGKPNEKGHKTHVSFYLVLMKGEYDATLRFPFPRIFRVTLIGRTSNFNIEKKIEPSNAEEFQKPRDDMNKPVGHSMFVSHKELSDHVEQYLWGDSLFFKIDFTAKSPNFSYYS